MAFKKVINKTMIAPDWIKSEKNLYATFNYYLTQYKRKSYI